MDVELGFGRPSPFVFSPDWTWVEGSVSCLRAKGGCAVGDGVFPEPADCKDMPPSAACKLVVSTDGEVIVVMIESPCILGFVSGWIRIYGRSHLGL